MSFCLPCGLTPKAVIEGLGELVAVGAGVLGQPEIAALVPLAESLAEMIAGIAAAPVLPPIAPGIEAADAELLKELAAK